MPCDDPSNDFLVQWFVDAKREELHDLEIHCVSPEIQIQPSGAIVTTQGPLSIDTLLHRLVTQIDHPTTMLLQHAMAKFVQNGETSPCARYTLLRRIMIICGRSAWKYATSCN